MNEAAFCREQVAPPGSNLYYSLLNQRVRAHRPLIALLAFQSEIANIGAGTPDPGIMQTRFAWWQEETARLFEGQPRHPISHELALLAGSGELAPEDLLQCVEFNAALAASMHFDGYDHWLEMAAAAHAGIWRAVADCCAVKAVESRETLIRLGGLLTIFERLQNAGRMGMRYVGGCTGCLPGQKSG